jgi:hypothetical protein
MKYKVGDLINNKWGNVDKLGYIVKVSKLSITIAFFHAPEIEVEHTFSGFERYYKVL